MPLRAFRAPLWARSRALSRISGVVKSQFFRCFSCTNEPVEITQGFRYFDFSSPQEQI